jgi:pyridoxamine 5'-phosphate oxidase
MIEWLNILTTALADEYADRPRVMMLATVAPDGSSRARSVVCRRIDDGDGDGDGLIWIASDARSDKNAEVRASPNVECLFWLARLRRQFRLRGGATVITPAYDPVARQIWHDMSPESRALFSWPPPGHPRVATAAVDAFPKMNTSDDLPLTFEVILVKPAFVEELDLNPHPHRRRRWTVESNWAAQELNP